ncbi:MAG TPA: YdeI/OmpD-associated family protein [Bacteroidales bacterium]|nr:YdeI/OmpD-associated family protein [Bacteroidales bacterium]
MKPIYFQRQKEFRKWLEKNHSIEKELIVGYYKKETGKPSMTWSESVDQALCFGWIDGIRRNVDDESYSIRFTPRRPGSNWSRVNIKKVEELSKAGLLTPVGLELFNNRKDKHGDRYSYENFSAVLPVEMEKLFRKNKAAWSYFEKQAPSYKKVRIYWINSAKQEETRMNRLKKLILVSEEGKRLF